MPLDTPVVLILFNRPQVTARVFEAVRSAQPKRLFLIADGPRNASEQAQTDAAREIVSRVDWDCATETNFSPQNLGCRRRVSGGLDWVFERCDEAIILEDDCLPDPSFFPFCHELLSRYRDDERISMISGDNFQTAPRGDVSYYFSAIAHVWGWGTWRRAWGNFQIDMASWPQDRNAGWLAELLIEPGVLATYQAAFDAVHAGRVDTWDAQWQLAVWRMRGLAALPCVNLVSNLGFGADATHTRKSQSADACLPVTAMKFPLHHPAAIVRDREADLLTWRRSMANKTISAPAQA